MDIEFDSLDELKKRITPALNIRIKELKQNNINTNFETLWNYFVSIWKNCHDLTLADMVDDVLNRDIVEKIDVL